jgi:hypothetical protein
VCAWSRCLCATDGEREREEEADIHSSIDPEAWSIYLLFHEIRKHSTGCPHPLPPSLLSICPLPRPLAALALAISLLWLVCSSRLRTDARRPGSEAADRCLGQSAFNGNVRMCVCAPDSLVMLILALPQ